MAKSTGSAKSSKWDGNGKPTLIFIPKAKPTLILIPKSGNKPPVNARYNTNQMATGKLGSTKRA